MLAQGLAWAVFTPSDRQVKSKWGKTYYKKYHVFFYAGRPLYNTYYFSIYLALSLSTLKIDFGDIIPIILMGYTPELWARTRARSILSVKCCEKAWKFIRVVVRGFADACIHDSWWSVFNLICWCTQTMSASQQADKGKETFWRWKILNISWLHVFFMVSWIPNQEITVHPHLSTFIQRVAKIADLAGNQRASMSLVANHRVSNKRSGQDDQNIWRTSILDHLGSMIPS